MPKIREMLLNLKVFKYAVSLDINMGCYHIHIRKQASNLFTITLPREYTGITLSPLPQNQGKSPLPLFGGIFLGNFVQFYYTKLP